MFALTAVVPAYSRLTSRQHPVVRAFRQHARGAAEADAGVLLDGAHLIREALAAKLAVRTLLVSSDFLAGAPAADRELAGAAAKAGARVYEAASSVIAAASPVRSSSGIVALAEWSPASIDRTFRPAPALVVGLVDVQDPGNVGSAIRSADALGASGVVAIGATAHPGGWKVLRGAMGSSFRLPVARGSHDAVVAASRDAGLRLIATVAEHARPLDEIDLTRPSIVLLGNEGAGLPPAIVAAAGERLTVPMRPGVNSLNVAVTAALVLYEARRQRDNGAMRQ